MKTPEPASNVPKRHNSFRRSILVLCAAGLAIALGLQAVVTKSDEVSTQRFEERRADTVAPDSSLTDEAPQTAEWFDELIREHSLGGAVSLRGKPVKDADLIRLQNHLTLWHIDLSNTQITNAGLVQLVVLKNLKSLSVCNTQIDDEGLRHLMNLANLKTLDLAGTGVSDAGLALLESIQGLDSLGLSHTSVTDAGLHHLIRLTKLRHLDLRHTKVTTEGIRKLNQALPHTRISHYARMLAGATVFPISKEEAIELATNVLLPGGAVSDVQASVEDGGWIITVKGDDSSLWESRYVIHGKDKVGHVYAIEIPKFIVIPGTYDVTVKVIDNTHKVLSNSRFSVGPAVDSQASSTVHAYGKTLVVFDTGRLREYYGIIGGEIALVRLEDSQGRPLRNWYDTPNHTVGPSVPRRTSDEWESALGADDTLEVLRSLIWVGGIHLNPSKPVPDYSHEPMEFAQLAEETRKREGVQKALSELLVSEDPWIREAAQVATKPKFSERQH